MSPLPRHSKCFCGARLWSKAELASSGDPLGKFVAEAYLDDESGFCFEEDEVVPYQWLDSVREGKAQADRGETVSFEEVFGEPL